MSSVSFGVGNVVPFPGKKRTSIHTSAFQKIDRKVFLDIVHSSKEIIISNSDLIARTYAVRFCILGLVQIEEQLEDGSFQILKPSQAFQNKSERIWRVSKRNDAGKVTVAKTNNYFQAIG